MIALLLSLSLVGGALWYRFVRIAPYSISEEIVTVRDANNYSSEDLVGNETSGDNGSAVLESPEVSELSEADVIGQRLFSDYISLKSQGQVTPDNVGALANTYAERIANTKLEVQKISLSELSTIPDSEENLTIYGKTMFNLRKKYRDLAAAEYSKSGNITEITSPSFRSFMGAVGKLYRDSADELKKIKVPNTLATNHREIINTYLESAVVIESFGNVSSDPIKAYAAINIYSKNSEKETALFINIEKTLQANGIILPSNS